jgi:ceramide glucosyltransferase
MRDGTVGLNLEGVLFALVLLSALYWLGALVCTAAFARRTRSGLGWTPPVSVLKPLLKDDGYLYDNLRSFCEQDYPMFEVLFGVQDENDPAVRVVHRLLDEFPERDLRLVVNARMIGTNHKMCNVANLCQEAKYGLFVLADSDMRVGPDYLGAVVAPLRDASVGLVTCLYKSVAQRDLGSTFAAMFVNEWFFPAALVAARLERMRHAFGATIACRRDQIRDIGGFEILADYLADDYMLGALISRHGLRVALSRYVVENVVGERRLSSHFFRELRWTRTFRTVRPVSYFLSLVTHGIPLSLLLVCASGVQPYALAILALHIALRWGVGFMTYAALQLPTPPGRLAAVPLRDSVSLVMWTLSFLGRRVRWNDRRLWVDRCGKLHPVPVTGASRLVAAIYPNRRNPPTGEREPTHGHQV